MSETNPFWRVGSAFRMDCRRPQLAQNQRMLLDRPTIRRFSLASETLFERPVIVTASPDWNAIAIYSLCWWDELLPRLWKLPKDSQYVRRFMSIFLGNAIRFEADAPLDIPGNLTSYAGFPDQGVFLAFDENYAEIWAESRLSFSGLDSRMD